MIPSIMAAWGMLMAVLVFGAPCRAFPAGAAVNRAMYTTGQPDPPVIDSEADVPCSVRDVQLIQIATDEVKFLRDLMDTNRTCAECLMKCRSLKSPFRTCADRCAVSPRAPALLPICHLPPHSFTASIFTFRLLAGSARELASRTNGRAGTRVHPSWRARIAFLYASVLDATQNVR
jgi:hypothetical protein